MNLTSLHVGDCVVVTRNQSNPQNGLISEMDQNHFFVTFRDPVKDNEWSPTLFTGTTEQFSLDDRGHVLAEKDHLLLKDNFKKLFGPAGLTFRSALFGTKLDKGNLVIESGMVLRPLASSDDEYTVVGVTVVKYGRKTDLQILLVNAESDNIFSIDSKSFGIVAQSPDRLSEPTRSSLDHALVGRHLANAASRSRSNIETFSDSDMFGKKKVYSTAKSVSFLPFKLFLQKNCSAR